MSLMVNEEFFKKMSLASATIAMCIYNYVVTLHWMPQFLLYLLLIFSIVCSWIVGLVYRKTFLNNTKIICLIFYSFLLVSFVRFDSVIGLTSLNWICVMSYLFLVGANKKTMIFLAKFMLVVSVIQCIGVLLEEFFYNVWYSVVSPAFSYSGYLNYIIRSHNQGYTSGFSYNPGFTAIFIIDGLIGLMILKSKFRDRVFYPLFVGIFLCLIMTGKRGEILFSIFALMVCYVALSKDFRKNLRRMLILLGIIVIILAIGYVLYIRNVNLFNIDRILNLIYSWRDITELNISSGRFDLWADAWSLFKDHPLAGIGWWKFSQIYGMEVHNVYLQILCELGIFAFAVYILMYFISLQRLIKVYRKGEYGALEKDILRAIIIFIVYFGFMGFVENVMSNPEFYYMFYFLIGYTVNSESSTLYQK